MALQNLTEWPLEALEIPKRVEHSKGDIVAITRGDPLKTTIGVIASSETVIIEGVPKYIVSLKHAENSALTRDIQVTIDVNPGFSDERRDLFLCPVYSGPRLSMITRDRNEHSIHTYKHTIHGYTTDTLMNIIMNWTEDSSSYAKLVESVRANPQHVRTVVEGQLPLFRAISDDLWNVVVMLISVGADKNARDGNDRTIVHVAAEKGLDKLLEGVLLLLPKEVNSQSRNGDTPLHLASRHAHAACIDRLLGSSSCLPCVANNNGDTPLHEICKLPESGNKSLLCSTVEQLLLLRSSYRNTTSKDGMNALHYAAGCGHVNVVNKLISLGLEVHRRDRLGRGVLHYALEKWTGEAEKDCGRLATIQALVKAGAPPNVVDLNGQTPVFQLVRDILKNNEQFPSTLVPVCAQLVRTNLNLDEMASRLRPKWQLATICFMVSNGADLNIKDRKGLTIADLCEDSSLRPIIVHISQTKQRTVMPTLAMSQDRFDASEVSMCTFSCLDSVATVKLNPCGHRVACVDCAERTSIRRCPVCYQFIAGASDQDGIQVLIGSRSSETLELERQTPQLSAEIRKKIAEDAAREAKIEVEREKQKELNLLRKKLEQLELETSCAICMDSKIAIVFNCGHTACVDCADKLNKMCHICRKTIETTQPIYS
uniref:RING-type domain-containing protein n=1 Tax=Caenorhabditis tropicalis TaxID=1561998 RepID=A0A1I7TM72_9PELO